MLILSYYNNHFFFVHTQFDIWNKPPNFIIANPSFWDNIYNEDINGMSSYKWLIFGYVFGTFRSGISGPFGDLAMVATYPSPRRGTLLW